MNKRELEEHVLELARPLIHKLYGDFDIDRNQTDRPDAAIDVKKPNKRFGHARNPFKVGIEITTTDKIDSLAYLKDEKFGRDRISAQITNSIEHYTDSKQPNKKIDVDISKSYIYDGVIKKSAKYSNYASSGTFREITLLCFSDVVCSRSKIFKEGLWEWTNFLLSRDNFPFDKVLFVDLLGGEPVRIYDKGKPYSVPPDPFKHAGTTITVTQGPFMRIGEQYNFNEIFSNDPLIAPKQKNTTEKP